MTTERVESHGTALAHVLFRIDGRPVTRGEVKAWANRFDATFAARRARRRALSELELDEDPSFDATLEEEAAEYRYSRGLESRESLVAWLDAHGLTVDGWWEVLRRNVLERRHAADSTLLLDKGTPPEGEDAEWSEAELVVSDLLASAVRAFARRAAVAASRTGWDPDAFPSPASRHDAIESEWQAWRREHLTESALLEALRHEGLAWLVYDLEESHWTSLDAAREAVSCVRLDARTLDDVAREAGVRYVTSTQLLAGVAEVVHDALLTSAPGEVVDPLRVGADWVVLRVVAKRPPSLAEPLVRAAAEEFVETRVAAPLVESRITWETRGA